MTLFRILLSCLLAVAPAPAQEAGIFLGTAGQTPSENGFISNTPSPAVGTAVVAGTVLSADAKRPVRRVTVRLSNAIPGLPRTMTTDDRGQFYFEKVPAGTFTITASKPGYIESIYGQKVAGSGRAGTTIPVAEGQRVADLTVMIGRGGVIAGTVVDDGGEPAFGTNIRALRYSWLGGERTLREVATTKVDDRGMYRLAALSPGSYIVMAAPASDAVSEGVFGPVFAAPGAMTMNSSANARGYAIVYYPGTTSAGAATSISLAVSEEKSGIDLQLPLVPMGRVRGTVIASTPEGAARAMVQLIDTNHSLPGMGVRMTRVGPNGEFEFTDVSPGRYRLHARTGPLQEISVDPGGAIGMEGARVMMRFEGPAPAAPPGAAPPFAFAARDSEPSEWASADVTVEGETPVTASLLLQPGMSISGTVTFDDTSARPSDLRPFRVLLNSARPIASGGLSSAIGEVDAEGHFEVGGIVPGAYRVSLLGPGGWRPKSFDVDGRDALDFTLEVEPNRSVTSALLTLTTRTASVSGTLQSATGQPTADYTIVLFAEDPQFWVPQSRRIQATRPATNGRFILRNLPAGSYRLVAVDDLENGQWFDPSVLQAIAASGIAVTLGPADEKEQNIRVSPR